MPSQHVRIAYVENVITRTIQGIVQEMSFMIQLDNLSYEKRVEVHWCGENGHWHRADGAYYCTLPDGRELWLALARCPLTSDHSLPGNISFAVRYETNGHVYWDNRHGHNYEIDADCGAVVYRDVPAQHLFHEPVLQGGKVSLPVDTAVRAALCPQQVRIHWSTDQWKTRHIARCFKRANQWDLARGSAARNPNRYGWEIWTGRIPVQHAYRIEYAVECETEQGVFWDNCCGANYQARRGTLRVLTLNLHCNQEENQAQKLVQVARAIEHFNIDLVCLQEVAEDWNDGRGDWSTNTAHIINGHLPFPYHIHSDYSHLGFGRYREGVAILSRHEFTATDSGYVSDSADVYDIHARRVVMAQAHVPYFGPVNVFCAHLSWPRDGFFPQFERMRHWANQRHDEHVTATLLCGDFNIKAGSDMYRHIVNTREYEDQFLKAVNRPAFQRVFRDRVDNVHGALRDDGRIDYIWLKSGSQLHLLDGRELFTEQSYGRVSDHTGYYIEFELA